MTKFEWERELKGLLKGIPRQEVDKVLQYYTELFSDKYEEGKTEMQIVREFGSPSEIARKILADYSGADERDDRVRRRKDSHYDNHYNQSRQEQQNSYTPPRHDRQEQQNSYTPPRHEPSNGNYSKTESRGLSTSTIVLIIVLSPLLIGLAAAIIGLTVGLWAGSISLIVASFAMPIAGVVNLFVTFVGVEQLGFLANLGASITIIGLGFVLMVASITLFKLVIRLTKWMFLLIGRMFGYRGDRRYA